MAFFREQPLAVEFCITPHGALDKDAKFGHHLLLPIACTVTVRMLKGSTDSVHHLERDELNAGEL